MYFYIHVQNKIINFLLLAFFGKVLAHGIMPEYDSHLQTLKLGSSLTIESQRLIAVLLVDVKVGGPKLGNGRGYSRGNHVPKPSRSTSTRPVPFTLRATYVSLVARIAEY